MLGSIMFFLTPAADRINSSTGTSLFILIGAGLAFLFRSTGKLDTFKCWLISLPLPYIFIVMTCSIRELRNFFARMLHIRGGFLGVDFAITIITLLLAIVHVLSLPAALILQHIWSKKEQ